MILKSLYLKNFRTYRGPEQINFASGDKNITIIQGNNEVGKTTIMNAITWCLYGVEFYKNEGNEPIWSRSVAIDLDNGDEDLVEVVLTMIDSKGKTVRFERKMEFYKNDIGKCRKGAVEDNIFVDNVPITFKPTYISKHLPKNIREYFLFDGEQLEKYFKEDNAHIKKSVYKLSQLDLLKRTKNHLVARERDFSNDLQKLNPSLGKYLKRETYLKELINNSRDKISEIESNIKKWESKVSDFEKRIAEYGDNPSKIIEQKNRLNNSLAKKDMGIKDAKEEYTRFLVKNFPKVLSINELLNVKSICKDLEEKGFIPAQIKKEFLEYLLETHKCICGADLSDGSDACNKIKELCDKTDETTNIADTVNILLGSVNNIIGNFPVDFKSKFSENISKIENLTNERMELSKEITNVQNLLMEMDEDEIKNLQESIITHERLIKSNYMKKGELNGKVKDYSEELEDIRKKIKEEEKKDNEKSDIQLSISFCRSALEEVERIYNELETEIHEKLQSLTSEEFSNMHWKEFYNGVSIDKDYNVVIHKEGGDIVPNDLSKGGQLVLALSFMTALNSLSGFELPIIIDTPLGRLDEPIKENIGKYLPVYTRNKQVTLLVTSSEYSVGFKKGIRDFVGEEYTLKYIQEKDGMTTIEKNS